MRGYVRVLALIVAGRFLAFLARMNIVSFYPELMARYATSYTGAGALFSVFFAGYILVLIPAGAAADRWPPRRQIALGLFLLGISGGVVVLAPSYPIALVARAVEGAAVALAFPGILKLVAVRFTRENRGRAVGIMEMANGLGTFAALSGLPFLTRWLDYQPLLLSMPALCGVTLLFILLFPDSEHGAGEAAPRPAPPLRDLFGRNMLLITVTNLFGLLVTSGIHAWLPTYLAEGLGYSKANGSLITAVVLGIQIAGVYPAGMVSDRLGRRLPVVQAGTLMFLAGFPALLLGSNFVWLMAAAVLLGLGMAWATTPLVVLTTELFGPERAGMVSSLTIAVAQVGSGLAGVLFGWLLDTTGSFAVVWLCATGVVAVRLVTAGFIREARS